VRVSQRPSSRHPWQLVGGHLALDLINTVAWQRNPGRRRDRLADWSDLTDWFAVAASRDGVDEVCPVADVDADRGARVLTRVRELRDACQLVLTAHIDRQTLPGEALELLRARFHASLAAADVPRRLPLRPEVTVRVPEDITTALGLAVGDLLCRPELDRLRRCADGDCGWFFLDHSRNRSRRWCDPGDCGNRNRVKAFVTRNRA
jgi:predicted RNA-binding Zn ribbon-like protein